MMREYPVMLVSAGRTGNIRALGRFRGSMGPAIFPLAVEVLAAVTAGIGLLVCAGLGRAARVHPGWQDGHQKVARSSCPAARTGVPHRRHGLPRRP